MKIMEKNIFTQNAFILCTALGLVLFTLTKEPVWIGVADAIGAGLQTRNKNKDNEE